MDFDHCFTVVQNEGAPEAHADGMRFVRLFGKTPPVMFRVPHLN